MIGPIIFSLILLLMPIGMIYSLRKGIIIVNDPERSIPVEFEAMEGHGVPLITLTSERGQKYTFLVDTGANRNYIDQRFIGEFMEEEREPLFKDSFHGIDGESREATFHNLSFTYRNSKLSDGYLVADISGVVENLKEDVNKDIHGVLGVPFLRKHRMSLDVNRMIVWKKL